MYTPMVAIVSLGSPTTLAFYQSLGDAKQPESCVCSVYLQPRSLVLFAEACYHELFHCIHEMDHDVIGSACVNATAAGATLGDVRARATRVSLTIRHVPSPAPAAENACDELTP